MASKTLETRMSQKSRYQEQMDSRRKALLDKGCKEEQVARDGKMKQLTAKIKQIQGALARISFLENQTKQLQEKKAQREAEELAARAALALGTRTKKKKAEEAPPPSTKKKAPAAAKAPAKGKTETKKKGK